MSVLTAVPAANDMTRMRLFSSFIKRFIPSQMFQNLSPHEFHEALIASKNAVLIDVRTPSEFQAGHIPGAVNIDIMSPHFLIMWVKASMHDDEVKKCSLGFLDAYVCVKGVIYLTLFIVRPHISRLSGLFFQF